MGNGETFYMLQKMDVFHQYSDYVGTDVGDLRAQLSTAKEDKASAK